MQAEKLNAIKGAVRDGRMVQNAGGISAATGQSDKLGFDWRIYSVNDVVVRKDYIEQESPVGTSADNPSYMRRVRRSSTMPFTGRTERSTSGWMSG